MSQDQSIPTGRQIVAARGLLGMSQEQLARIVDLTVTALSRIEHGKAVPKPETHSAIKKALEDRGIRFRNGNNPTVSLEPDKAIIPI